MNRERGGLFRLADWLQGLQPELRLRSPGAFALVYLAETVVLLTLLLQFKLKIGVLRFENRVLRLKGFVLRFQARKRLLYLAQSLTKNRVGGEALQQVGEGTHGCAGESAAPTPNVKEAA